MLPYVLRVVLDRNDTQNDAFDHATSNASDLAANNDAWACLNEYMTPEGPDMSELRKMEDALYEILDRDMEAAWIIVRYTGSCGELRRLIV